MSTEEFCLEGENYYEVLESERTATTEQIKDNYQRLVRLLHPDKQSNRPINKAVADTNTRFLALQRAWAVMKDPQNRRRYDAALACREHTDILLYETLDLSELQHDEEGQVYRYPCRCGGCYLVSEDEASVAQVTVGCDECSFSILNPYVTILHHTCTACLDGIHRCPQLLNRVYEHIEGMATRNEDIAARAAAKKPAKRSSRRWYCAVLGCTNSYKNIERKCFRFPLDEVRGDAWIRASGRSDLKKKSPLTLQHSYQICDVHFLPSDRQPPTFTRLNKNAIPSLVLPQTESNKCTKFTQIDVASTSDFSHQTEFILFTASETGAGDIQNLSINNKRKLQIIKNVECKMQKLIGDQIFCDDSASPQLKKLLNYRRKLQIDSSGNRYDRENLFFSLNLYLASPITYRIFSKTLNLPSPRGLESINVEITTKLTPNAMKCLQSQVMSLKDSEKYCVICADEMSLKPNLYYQIHHDKIVGFNEIDGIQTPELATQAFVVMARGLSSKWKLPLGYCFLSEKKNHAALSKWLEDLISKTIDIGYNVVAFVTNQESNISMTKDNNVSNEQPFFYVNSKKIYHVFDAPNLLKSVRNNFMKYIFEFTNASGTQFTASWKDIEKLYEYDKDKPYRLVPKLTISHIMPNSFEKTQIEYAMQAMSRTVATAVKCCIDLQILPNTSIGTATFVEAVDTIFDILNSSTVNSTSKFKQGFTQQEYQVHTLETALTLISGIRIMTKNGKDVTKSIKCFEGLHKSIMAILKLANDLKSNEVNVLFTRRLNLDCLENFFGLIKQGGNCRQPTPIQFSAVFKKLFIVNLMNNSQHTNRSDDLNCLLSSAEEYENGTNKSICPYLEPTPNPIHIGTVDYRFQLPKKNAFRHVCGYLLNKGLEVHKNCQSMKKYVSNEGSLSLNHIFTNPKAGNENNSAFRSQPAPPKKFVHFVRKMDSKFKMSFRNVIQPHIGHYILNELNDLTFDMPCKCFPIYYIKKLFVRFRMFTTLQCNNRHSKDTSSRCFVVSQL